MESTDWNPVPSASRWQLLKKAEIVQINIALYPSSTFFMAGESIKLIIGSSEIISTPPYIKNSSFNHGKHIIHYGGKYDSHLLVPKI
jgi:predicted acyl esterase